MNSRQPAAGAPLVAAQVGVRRIARNLVSSIPRERVVMNYRPSLPSCPKCGEPIPGEASQGLCPKCALAAVAATAEGDGPPPGRSVAPDLATVAAAFPQLEVRELIGAGGMGAVYKARQPRLDRFVGLKLLSPSLAASAAFAERFHREARVLARLDHPGIAPEQK